MKNWLAEKHVYRSVLNGCLIVALLGSLLPQFFPATERIGGIFVIACGLVALLAFFSTSGADDSRDSAEAVSTTSPQEAVSAKKELPSGTTDQTVGRVQEPPVTAGKNVFVAAWKDSLGERSEWSRMLVERYANDLVERQAHEFGNVALRKLALLALLRKKDSDFHELESILEYSRPVRTREPTHVPSKLPRSETPKDEHAVVIQVGSITITVTGADAKIHISEARQELVRFGTQSSRPLTAPVVRPVVH